MRATLPRAARAHRPVLCAHCRARARPTSVPRLFTGASPATAPFTTAARRSAPPDDKDPIPFSERFRRRMWGTDNPPGQKDPYSPASPEEKAQLEAEEQRLQAEEAATREARRARRRAWLGRSESNSEASKPVTASAVATDEAAADVGVDVDADADASAGQALVAPSPEVLQELGYVEAYHWDGLPHIGGTASQDAHVSAYLDEHPFTPWLPPRQAEAPGATRVIHAALTAALAEQGLPAANDEWMTTDLTDPDLKLLVAKYTMQQTGTRIPDPVLTRVHTVADLVAHLSAPAPPTTLAAQLRALPALQRLPNVEVWAHRRSRDSIDVEFGRAKVIRRELAARDLLGAEPAPHDFQERLRADDAAAAAAEEARRAEEEKKKPPSGGNFPPYIIYPIPA